MGLTGYIGIGLLVLFLLMGGSVWYYKSSYEDLIKKNAEIELSLKTVQANLDNTNKQIENISNQQKILNDQLTIIRKNSLKQKQEVNNINISKEQIPNIKDAEKLLNEQIKKSLRLGETK